jgi:hypothetical protein
MMRNITTILLFAALFYFSGCSGPVSVGMEEYAGKKADCAVPVIDERAEKRLIIDYDGTSDSFDLSPLLQESLSYQICQSQVIRKYAENNRDFKVTIGEVNATYVPYSYESEITIVLIGYVQDRGKKSRIRSVTTEHTTERTKRITSSLIRDIMYRNITDFASKVENYVRQSSR